MRNSQVSANCNSVICQGAMRHLYGEGTGSIIVEEQSAPYQGVPWVWDLLRHDATQKLWEGHTATTGACLVFIINCIDSLEAPTAIGSNFEAALPPTTLSPGSVLDRVRSVFGLNISETAEVFGITRQTAYQWMKLVDMEQVRSYENRDRIGQLYRATQSWQNFPPLKGRWLHALLPVGNTVFDLLKATQTDLNALQDAYLALAASTPDRRRKEGERATQAVTALAGALAGLGAGRKARNE